MQSVEGAGVLLYTNEFEEYVWLIERNPGYKNNDKHRHELEYPGGKFEDKDSIPENTAIREVEEEMGIRLDVKQLVKSVVSVPPGKTSGVYLFAAHLRDSQHWHLIEHENGKWPDGVRFGNTAEHASLRPVCVRTRHLLEYLNTERKGLGDNNLGVRAFNTIMLKNLLKQQ
jgi:8-oxo-dGTP pyrophosphatase MutT (NUDIX family)